MFSNYRLNTGDPTLTPPGCCSMAYGQFIQHKDVICRSSLHKHAGHRIKYIQDYELDITICWLHNQNYNIICLDCHLRRCEECRNDPCYFDPLHVLHYYIEDTWKESTWFLKRDQENLKMKGDHYFSQKQYSLAMKCYLDAAQRGDNQACLLLIKTYFILTSPENSNNKIYSVQDLLLDEIKNPVNNLWYLYKNSLCDPVQTIAAGMFLRSAKSGLVDSQFQIGLYLAHGIGLPQNIQNGLMYLELAAKKNHPEACMALGQYYFYVTKKLEEAEKWYLRVAIDLNYARGNYGQGNCIRYSKTRNYQMAYMHYMLAALDDEPLALCAIGELYMESKNKEKSITKARLFFLRAAKYNIKSAIDNLLCIEALENRGIFHEICKPPDLTMPEESVLNKHLSPKEMELFRKPVNVKKAIEYSQHFPTGQYFDCTFKELSKPTSTETTDASTTEIQSFYEIPDVKNVIIGCYNSIQVCTQVDNVKNNRDKIQYALTAYKQFYTTKQHSSIFTLGMLYLEFNNSTDAFKCFKKSAKLKNIKASYMLSLCYIGGIGTTRKMKPGIQWAIRACQYDWDETIKLEKNTEEAECEFKDCMKWLNNAKAVGTPDKYHRDVFKNVVFNRVIEMLRDIGKFRQHEDFKLIVLHNEESICINSANLYYYGIGYDCDYTKALQFYECAGYNDKNPRGFIGAGLMLLRGHGREFNLPLALIYFKKAVDLGDDNAEIYIKFLENYNNPTISDIEKRITINAINNNENLVDQFKLNFKKHYPSTTYFNEK
ncbi:hypothetical protein DLAC_05223 [Tieghemostelium lacteum]|uniref:Uncharacterized protein n=1 Tax=Tieghemostelium lacteum TaxID=361077 RepID=A0A151ZIU4_TIELA|nr:hypothetical protein DLAC_05223 [Tieghemostelium lacteum]|eukprot:KYQ93825.1 hypothetical protein DLAC_05223 [Tieghemostelium lacteum]